MLKELRQMQLLQTKTDAEFCSRKMTMQRWSRMLQMCHY